MGHLGIWELLVIFLVVLILFGAKKLPEIGNALGKAIKEFKKAGQESEKDPKETDKDKNKQ